MAGIAKPLTLWCSLFGVTVSILLVEGVPLGTALSWGAIASSAKSLIVAVHSWIWRQSTSKESQIASVDSDTADLVSQLAEAERQWMRLIDEKRHGEDATSLSVFVEPPFE